MQFNLFKFHVLALVIFNRIYSFNQRNPTTHRFNSNLYQFLRQNQRNLHSIRGSQSYLPSEQRLQKWLQNKWETTSKNFGFQEYSIPVLTHTALFVDSNTPKDEEHYKELYSFKDKKGRSLSLRGDITPQFMNLLTSYYSNKKLQSHNIYKWYTIADCWRYERPGLGRRRNHQQWNADIVGISDIQVEVELISMLVHFFKSVGLSYEDVVISLNHRNTITGILTRLGFSNYSSNWIYEFSKTLDKYKKIPKDQFNKLLLDLQFTPDQCSELEKIIETSKTIEELEGIFKPEDIRELKQLVNLLAEKGYSKWINIDLTIVRGNDYYTGLVFECFDRNQIHSRSIAGGGRYDNYFKNCDPRLMYSAGFGMGNIAIMDLIKQKGLNVKSEQLIDVLVFTPNTIYSCEQKLATDFDQSLLCSKNQRMCLYNLMDLLRNNDVSVYQYYKTSRLVKALKFGDSCMAKFVLMPLLRDGNEVIVLRDMDTGLQEFFNPSDDQIGAKVMEKLLN